ncbi:hypothetical protein [Gallibacterium anatis]|uniref:Uncharacterized protein n=2 Tax=Gallibacterium anatis TaxID=750 RepID=F4HFL1_GALAU|nr:hypothetical protein [Gallibacterium anatis]AEC17052.1 hypothetical protein UMN179_01024 [Gallibacterium anatis UMN179]KGQ45622.1 hypothetical protein JP28_00035 [Gallibacterium anatis]KGQ49493.1 hypothetical protein IO46_10750 [Gallibacterium anatis]KGQ52879.1 hypothetical protein JL12_00530 [Gallibacterium anatis 10672-6]KGQ58844.1 hypothetical protein IO45_07990 [Gallibacterium anatis]
MLSKERKSQMVESLKKDYVVLTDIVVEVVADTMADMWVLSWEKRQPVELESDQKRLLEIKKAYSDLYLQDQEKAVDMIEKIYELSDKYSRLRKSKGL